MTMLAIMRHAKSSWDDDSLDDFDRPLNHRGRTAAKRVGHELKRERACFDMVLASPALRVRQTLDHLADGFGPLPPVQFEDSLYGAGSERLLEAIRSLPGHVHAPLLVGHNPGLYALLLALTGEDPEGMRSKVAGKFPTAAFARIDLPAVRWDELAPGSGLVRALILPRELD